jgi:hypothetical protein
MGRRNLVCLCATTASRAARPAAFCFYWCPGEEPNFADFAKTFSDLPDGFGKLPPILPADRHRLERFITPIA